jgi:hypothetical protein
LGRGAGGMGEITIFRIGSYCIYVAGGRRKVTLNKELNHR